MPISKDFIAASATPLILSILRQGDSYGYDIIQKVHTLSNGQMQWADGMLYPILHRLEKNGLVKSYWGKAETGRKRKYYMIEKAGLKALEEQLTNWRNLNDWLDELDGAAICTS